MRRSPSPNPELGAILPTAGPSFSTFGLDIHGLDRGSKRLHYHKQCKSKRIISPLRGDEIEVVED